MNYVLYEYQREFLCTAGIKSTVLLYFLTAYGNESTLNLHGFLTTFARKLRAPRETFDFSGILWSFCVAIEGYSGHVASIL